MAKTTLNIIIFMQGNTQGVLHIRATGFIKIIKCGLGFYGLNNAIENYRKNTEQDTAVPINIFKYISWEK